MTPSAASRLDSELSVTSRLMTPARSGYLDFSVKGFQRDGVWRGGPWQRRFQGAKEVLGELDTERGQKYPGVRRDLWLYGMREVCGVSLSCLVEGALKTNE